LIKALLRRLGCLVGVRCDFVDTYVHHYDMPGWKFPARKCRTCGHIDEIF
jgi:hypothetical protein